MVQIFNHAKIIKYLSLLFFIASINILLFFITNNN